MIKIYCIPDTKNSSTSPLSRDITSAGKRSNQYTIHRSPHAPLVFNTSIHTNGPIHQTGSTNIRGTQIAVIPIRGARLVSKYCPLGKYHSGAAA